MGSVAVLLRVFSGIILFLYMVTKLKMIMRVEVIIHVMESYKVVCLLRTYLLLTTTQVTTNTLLVLMLHLAL